MNFIKEKSFGELLVECSENISCLERLYNKGKVELKANSVMASNTNKHKAKEVFIEWLKEY